MVTIKFLDASGTERRIVRTPAFENTTEPRWEYDFFYDETLDGGRWLVEADDIDSGSLDPIGSMETTFTDLLRTPRLTFGSVKELNFIFTNLGRGPRSTTAHVVVAAEKGRLVRTGIR